MSTISYEANPAGAQRQQRSRLNKKDVRANRLLKRLALAGGILVLLAMFGVAFQVIDGATQAFNKYGVAFIWHKTWSPSPGHEQYGAWTYIYGTLITGAVSLVIATVLGVAIGLFLSLLAPRRISTIIGPLVEMLAAVPSVVLGLIGIFLICPFIRSDIEPWVHSAFGWIPLFGTPQAVGNSLFAASLVLTIMVVPIIAALTRDLFMTVPRDLRDGAEALGATRWEMIRGVVLPTTQSGVVAACVLGFGRAIGEAIAVAQVVGGASAAPLNLFEPGNTAAAGIAIQFPSPISNLQTSALFYLAGILFVFSIITNLTARQIARRGARFQ